jgi:hypothetical protein
VDYYRNVSASEVEALPLHEWFSIWTVHYAPIAADLYVAGVRRGPLAEGAVTASLPTPKATKAIATIMPLGDRLVRTPLALLARVTSDEGRFQRVAIPYWRAALPVLRAAGMLGAMVRRHARR